MDSCTCVDAFLVGSNSSHEVNLIIVVVHKSITMIVRTTQISKALRGNICLAKWKEIRRDSQIPLISEQFAQIQLSRWL